jgi:hypothetical protein
MTTRRERIGERFRRRLGTALLGAFAAAWLSASFPGNCRAAEPLGPARPSGLPEVLASVSVLSEAAMAKESAAGVEPAPIIGEQTGHARVLLWDEMKAPPELPLGTNGTVTLSIGGVGK